MKQDRPPETVRAYLDALARAMRAQGCRPGVISDALADCEEHLNNEIASNPGHSEAEILSSVIATYGTPEEIAEEYKSMEAAISGPFPKADQPSGERRYGFFGIIRDPRAYGALMYMLLSLATGIFYFTWTLTFGIISLVFLIFIIGVPLALLFLGSIRALSLIEGRLVEGLLGVRMPRRLPAANVEGPSGTWWQRMWTPMKDALTDVRTWSSVFYLLLMLPLGIVYFVIAVVGVALSLGIPAVAIWSLITGESHVQMTDLPMLEHLFRTAPGLFLLIIAGVLLFFVVLHIARGIGWLHGRIAELLLVRL